MTEKEILLTSILDCSRTALYADRLNLDAQAAKGLSRALSLRSRGFPLQYILGEMEFFGLKFKVDKRVFIPRPETELLVETAIRKIANRLPAGRQDKSQIATILDIGTGSGCIAVSLAKFLPSCEITAIDISYDALAVAKENAILNSVSEKINFIQSDLFTPLETREQPGNRKISLTGFTEYGLIISNPPYIRSGDIKNLQREVKYEPRLALDGGYDGLDFYHKIVNEAPNFLKKGGWLLLEMGFKQCGKIRSILQKSKNFEIMDVLRDYSGIERVMVARRLDIDG